MPAGPAPARTGARRKLVPCREKEPMARMERIRADAPDLKAAIRNNYDAIAARYDWVLGAPEWLGLRRLRRSLLAHARGRVLEIGVGTGRNLPLYPPGLELHAVDFSPAMLERAGARARRLGLAVALREMDAERLDFPDAGFDTVVCTLVTCTLPHPLEALREMRRVVRPAGRVLLLEHGFSDRPWLRRVQLWRAERQFAWLGCRWDREPHLIAGEAGLRLEQHRRYVLGALHWMVLRPEPAAA
jgi:ubiquinone/menaquinone biosynthesis C-methylase UbiE